MDLRKLTRRHISVDAAAVITATYPLDEVVEEFRGVADCTELGVGFTSG